MFSLNKKYNILSGKNMKLLKSEYEAIKKITKIRLFMVIWFFFFSNNLIALSDYNHMCLYKKLKAQV